MTQIDLAIANTNLISQFGVRVDGLVYTNSFGAAWSATHSGRQAFSSCTLEVVTPFTLTPGRHRLELYAGYQGTQDLVFAGEITAQGSGYFARHDQFTCGGYLKRLEVGLNVSYFYYNTTGTVLGSDGPIDAIPVPIVTDADIIVHILTQYGITPSTTGFSIEASAWKPAMLDGIVWQYGTPGWGIVQQLDLCSPTYTTFDGRTGAVYRRPQFGSVPSTVKHTFTQGIDILDMKLGQNYDVYNQVIVRGAQDVTSGNQVIGVSPVGSTPLVGTDPFVPPPPNPYVANPPGYRTDERIQSNYIETVPSANAIADTWLGVVIQPLQPIQLTTFGCTDFDVGDALGVDAPAFPFTANAFAVSHTVSNAPLRSSWELQGSTTAEIRPNQPPRAALLVTVESETVQIGGVATLIAVVTADGTGSSDSDGTIAAWSITIGSTTFTGTDITKALVTDAYTAASPVVCSITVTDDGGLSNTLSVTTPFSSATAVIEPLATAENDRGEDTQTGGSSWSTFSATVTTVAPIALGGAVCFGCSGGQIYRSTDALATAPTLVQTLPAAVNCLWNNETATARWLAGLANGQVYLSIDSGVSWTLLYSF